VLGELSEEVLLGEVVADLLVEAIAGGSTSRAGVLFRLDLLGLRVDLF